MILALSCGLVFADEPAPWAVGVSDVDKATARRHLDLGNDLFLARKYTEALGEYRKAIAAWNHPAIRFNIVRSLIHLERWLDASNELELALRYDKAPFEDAIFNEALSYKKLLASQIGELEIACEQPGVQITVAGEAIDPCPGTYTRRVLPGQLQVVGTKAGFLTRTQQITVLGGKRARVVVELDPLSKAARLTRRWRTWIPWATVLSGIGVAAIGGLLELSASSNLESYNQNRDATCRDVGCSGLDRGVQDRALLEDKIAVGVIAVGAATVVTGLAMVYLNRGRVVHDLPAETKPVRVEVAPRTGGGVVALEGSF